MLPREWTFPNQSCGGHAHVRSGDNGCCCAAALAHALHHGRSGPCYPHRCSRDGRFLARRQGHLPAPCYKSKGCWPRHQSQSRGGNARVRNCVHGCRCAAPQDLVVLPRVWTFPCIPLSCHHLASAPSAQRADSTHSVEHTREEDGNTGVRCRERPSAGLGTFLVALAG